MQLPFACRRAAGRTQPSGPCSLGAPQEPSTEPGTHTQAALRTWALRGGILKPLTAIGMRHSCDSQSLIPEPAASPPPGDLSEMQILGPHSRLSQNLWGYSPRNHVLMSPPGASDTCSCGKATCQNTAVYGCWRPIVTPVTACIATSPLSTHTWPVSPQSCRGVLSSSACFA